MTIRKAASKTMKSDSQRITLKTASFEQKQLAVESEPNLEGTHYFPHLCAKQRRRINYHRRHHTHVMVRGIRALPIVDLCSPISAEALTKKSFKWEFNIFALDRLTANRSLFYMAWYLFNYYELIAAFRLDVVRLCRTFYLIEELYHSCNPYHNALHAADVAQAMHCFLRDPKLASHLSKLDIMACILAAFCHDLDHPGRTATFLTATDHVFTKLYGNQGSILERHHWLATRSLFQETGLFEHAYMDEHRTKLFETIEDMILATDMSHHAQFVKQLHDCKKRNSDSSVTLQFDISKSEQEKRLALHLTLKCADICNPARAWPQCRAWAELIVAEFFAQGDAERLAGRTCSMAMNRKTDQLAKIQISFIKYIIQPLFNLWCSWLNSTLSRGILSHVASNYRRWEFCANANPSVTSVDNKSLNWSTDKENQRKNNREATLSTLSSAAASSPSRRYSLPLNVIQSTVSCRRRGSCQTIALTNSSAQVNLKIHARFYNLLEVYVITDEMEKCNLSSSVHCTSSTTSHCSKPSSDVLLTPRLAQLNQRRRGSAPAPALLGKAMLTQNIATPQLRRRSGSISSFANFSLPSSMLNHVTAE